MLYFLIVVFIWAMGWLLLDSSRTAKGVAAGVAVEKNTFIGWVAGTDKPTFWQAFSVEAGLVRVPMFLIGLWAFLVGLLPVTFLAAFGLVIAAFKNIRGARRWQWMFDHPGQRLPDQETWWQKLVG